MGTSKHKPTICVITQYFHPDFTGSAMRSSYAIQSLMKLGYKIKLVTGVPHYPDGNQRAIKELTFYRRYYMKHLEVVRLWMPPISSKGSIGKFINYLYFMLVSCIGGLVCGDYDVIFAASPNFFSNFTGLFLKLIKRKPLVVNINDLVPEALTDLKLVESSKFIRLLQLVRNFTLNLSDRVVCISNSISEFLMSSGVHKNRLVTIEVGIDLSRIDDLSYAPDAQFDNSRLHIVYSGNLGMAYDFSYILQIAKESLRQGHRYNFTIRGRGSLERVLHHKIEIMDLINVQVLSKHLTNTEYTAFMQSADIFILPMKNNMISRTALPSKLFDYLAFKRPILVIGEGEPADLVRNSGAGLAIKHDELASALWFLNQMESDIHTRLHMGNLGREYVTKHFSLEIIGRKLDRLFQSHF
ncbi:MAG: glycosyltransferase family 4 protein [Candidatus Thorarchaeota archaeon]